MRRCHSLRLHLVARIALAGSVGLVACGNPIPGQEGAGAAPSPVRVAPNRQSEQGEPAAPGFVVRGELEGMLLVWFDQQGLHTAKRRSEIPEARRRQVRVESLRAAPGQRLDPDHVYIADLSKPGANDSYSVRTHTRAWFDAQVDAARPTAEASTVAGDGRVTIYKASWCGACRAAAKYLQSRHVAFVEKDIEQDSEANAEMLRKARAAGKQPSGVPVIDFRGQIVLGFDQATLDRLIGDNQAI
jgi:glutaredoxin 3